jgi:hypothetical protein
MGPRVKEFFALENGDGVFLALLFDRPDDLAVKNGFRYDRAGRYRDRLTAAVRALMSGYVVVSSSA